MSNIVRFIGDVHGQLSKYAERCRPIPDTVCMGEMGFDLKRLVSVYLKHDAFGDEATPRHLILPGNHDNYDTCRAFTTFLTVPGYGQFDTGPLSKRPSFYVRGAASIDKQYRTIGRDWFPQEELDYRVLDAALGDYLDVKPDIMVTHTCPDQLVQGIPLIPAHYEKFAFRTEAALQQMFEAHQPRIWLFGHFHMTGVYDINGTRFVALGELATCDLDVDSLKIEVGNASTGYTWHKED